MQLRDGTDDSIGCNDDASCGDQSSLTRDISGPGLFWTIIDGCLDCGAYTMRYSY